MKKTFKTISIVSLSLLLAATAITTAVAWFKNGIDITIGGDTANISGGIEKNFFGKVSNPSSDPWGTSATNPYVIETKDHLYNLAWLQYIGYFNTANHDYNPQSGAPTTQIYSCYFKLADSLTTLDMSGITLPPIGTETYPFFGHFDGNNKTITNLTISNDNPNNSDSDFGIVKPSVIPTYAGQPRVVGFFGAIGKIPTNTTIGSYDVSSITPSMSNVTFNNLTINSKKSETLVGLAAGYVDGRIDGVKVGKSSVSVNNTEPISTITDNLSDYSLVGYAETTSMASDITKNISNRAHKQVSGGQTGGFGDSVNFKDRLCRSLRTNVP